MEDNGEVEIVISVTQPGQSVRGVFFNIAEYESISYKVVAEEYGDLEIPIDRKVSCTDV